MAKTEKTSEQNTSVPEFEKHFLEDGISFLISELDDLPPIKNTNKNETVEYRAVFATEHNISDADRKKGSIYRIREIRKIVSTDAMPHGIIRWLYSLDRYSLLYDFTWRSQLKIYMPVQLELCYTDRLDLDIGKSVMMNTVQRGFSVPQNYYQQHPFNGFSMENPPCFLQQQPVKE